MNRKKHFFLAPLLLMALFAFIFLKQQEKQRDKAFYLVSPSHFLKNDTVWVLEYLNQEQGHELRDILSQYDLEKEGETKNAHDVPFLGTLAYLRVEIEGKPYLLSVVRNTKHIYKQNDPKHNDYQKKLFWLDPLDDKDQVILSTKSLDLEDLDPQRRVFESPRLYAELEAFLQKHAVPYPETKPKTDP